MAEMLTVASLIQRNNDVAHNHQPLPFLSELGPMGIAPPNIIILTCVDPRSNPAAFMNLQPGDGVLIMRNLCGHVSPAMNDILALDTIMKITDILVIHHTDCGATHFQDAQVRTNLKSRAPGAAEIDSMEFGAVTDIEQSVKDDLIILKSSPFIRKELSEHCIGFVFDIKSGKLTPVQV